MKRSVANKPKVAINYYAKENSANLKECRNRRKKKKTKNRWIGQREIKEQDGRT